MSDIGGANTGDEPHRFVKAMDARIGTTALQQNVMAVGLPRQSKQVADDGAPMAFALPAGMGRDIFEETMPPAATQQIGRCNQRRRCNDRRINGRHRDMRRVRCQNLSPKSIAPVGADRIAEPYRFVKIDQRGKIAALRQSDYTIKRL